MEDRVISLTAQIVSAHVANHDVAVEQLPAFIREVHQALAVVGQAGLEPTKPEPAVAAKNSVFADHIFCLDCGKSLKILKRHLSTDHQMTPDEYRTKWGLSPSYPMVAAEYAASRSQLAKASGLGQKVAPPPPPPKKRGGPKRS
jgi:predicted transcriptional regulator